MKIKKKGILYIQCPACGTEVPAGSEKCSRCGEPVDLPVMDVATRNKSNKVVMWLSIIGTVALVLFVLFGVGWVLWWLFQAILHWSPV